MIGLLLSFLTGAAAEPKQDFATWLEDFRVEALTAGIRPQTLDLALHNVRLQPLVIELDRKQPEGTITYQQYLDRVLPVSRRRRGASLLSRHRALLRDIETTYGVQPQFIVALWGMESSFGKNSGSFPVLASLASLAYDGRREALFRRELLEALWIIDEGHVQSKDMLGSWAGAMGQSQFMPSSFRQFAVDYNGDGRYDIWTTVPDVFASMANYLKQTDWHAKETWGQRVTLTPGFDTIISGLEHSKPLAEWQALGVRRADGGDLPSQQLPAALIFPGGVEGPAFLVYHNYHVLLQWNRSHYFATAIGQFADYLAGP